MVDTFFLHGPVRIGLSLLGVLLFSAAACEADAAGATSERAVARQILEATGVEGGLVVHLGCGDGKLTAALHAGDGFLVQGLDADATHVEATRQHIQSLGLYGKVTAEQWDSQARGRLPYVDNLVSLVVVDELDGGVGRPAPNGAGPAPNGGVAMDEVMRVLRPGGVACIKSGDTWTNPRIVRKPRPHQIDEWTHFLHGPDNNAVARDSAVDLPYHIQWIGEPDYSRSHQFLTSMSAMVSAGGRLFAIVDEGPSILDAFMPAHWSLVARDAFSGVLLWKRPISAWQPANQQGRIPFPPDLFRRLVAVGDRVYTTLDIFGPVLALDAATGKTVHTYEGTEKTEEILACGGVLYLVIPTADAQNIDRRQATLRRGEPANNRIVAIRAETGDVLWAKEDADTTGYLPLTLATDGSRAVFKNADAVVCLDAATGRPLWRHAQKSPYARAAWSTATVVLADGVVLSADRSAKRGGSGQLLALAADSGDELWQCDCAEGLASPTDVLVVGGQVWVGENPNRKDLDFRTVRDLHTGEVREQFGPTDGWATWHHHRCYREKATTRYLLAGRTGVEFIDVGTGQLTPNYWIRGICRYGILPANGLLYLPPDQCACYIESKLCGYDALAPKRPSDAADENPEINDQRLFRGPAFGEMERGAATIHRVPPDAAGGLGGDWPTFRHDAARSGRTASQVGLELKPRWSTDLGGKLTALTSADGKVYVAQVDAHAVVCLDAESGRVLWRYVAGGRVDSPPTIASGIAVFGAHDGCVYALRASDGQLIWRFRAAPDDRRLVDHGQVESVWPVHGSTLVEDGGVYVAAGRNSYFDGGVWLYKLDLATGKTLLKKRYYSRDPKTGQRVALFEPFQGEVLPDRELPGLLPDVFSADENGLYLRSVALKRDLDIVGLGKPHLFCSMGLLDDASWERTYWLFGTHMYSGARGWGYAKTVEPAGRIMTFDDTCVYGFQDATFPESGLCAAAKEPERIEPSLPARKGGRRAAREEPAAGKKSAKKRTADRLLKVMKFAYDWRSDVPINVRAMVLADDRLFVAGPPRFDEQQTLAMLQSFPTDPATLPPLLADAVASVEGKDGSIVRAVGKSDGKKLAEVKLDSAPVFDGMIAAGGRLYLSTLAGRVVCLGD